MDYLTAKVEKNEETTNFLCFFNIIDAAISEKND